jgi:hypothetical protein
VWGILVAALQGPAAPAAVQVGDVQAVYWNGDATLAVALAEFADRAGAWPGLPAARASPLTLFITRSDARFDSLTRGRLPAWTGAAAFPRSSTIVLKVTGDPFPTLRHELAHLVLARAAPRAPLWFAEGYAGRAAGEWSALAALEVNWALARGRAPGFDELEHELRAGPSHARAAYALATAAVLYLERLGGERGLEPLLTQLAEAPDFETAVRRAHRVSLESLEAGWQRDLRRRYGWLLLLTSFTAFWGITALVVGIVWWRRRRRDRVRRAALDIGWDVPGDPDGAA